MCPRRCEPPVGGTTTLVAGSTGRDAAGSETDESTRTATETSVTAGRAATGGTVAVGRCV